MKTNLLAQNDNLVIENLKADVGKSVMDLSHSVTFPIDVDGAILPICCVETLPSDSFEISVEVLLRQLSPLKVPLMTNLRLNTAFYFCDNRMAWKKWDRFMTGGRTGNEVYDIPRLANYFVTDPNNVEDPKPILADVGPENGLYSKIKLNNTLHTYFGISMNHKTDSSFDYADISDEDSSNLPLAFPFFDYQLICRDYYTNVDRLPKAPSSDFLFTKYDELTGDWCYDNLFPSDDDEIRLKDGISAKSGFNSGDDHTLGYKGFILDKVRYHDVRPDYFSTSKKAPMRGDAPSITATQSDLKLDSGTAISLQNVRLSDGDPMQPNTYKQYMPVVTVQPNGIQYPTLTQTDVTSDGLVKTGRPTDPDVTYDLGVQALNDGGLYGRLAGDVSLTGTFTTTVTAAELRLLSQLTVWQELNMLHEPYYNDFLNAHFDNVRVGESPVEKPQYIGGTSQVISINEILQTSQSTDSSPLGNQGATAMSLASNNVGKYYCNNYGYIIGVCYIVPDMLYKPAMPRGFSRRTKEDYYSPEFANLSMQATLNKEIFYSDDDDWNNSPWGYTGAFDELRSIPNRIAGDLLNDDYTDIKKWVLTREFDNDNLPSMSTSWLSLKDNVDKTAWAVPTMPAFMLQCANYIKAVRPMPKVAIPKAL